MVVEFEYKQPLVAVWLSLVLYGCPYPRQVGTSPAPAGYGGYGRVIYEFLNFPSWFGLLYAYHPGALAQRKFC